MSQTTQCPQCGVVLNLPPGAEGKRLKCPKCGTKFTAGQPDTRPPSSAPGVADAGAASSMFGKAPPGDLPIPRAEGDLRETFDLPLMLEADAPAGPKPSARSDAAALFDDDRPAPRRRSAAEARAQSRRCPTCSGVVPAGMSVCSFCGLDLETGMRVGLDDDLDVVPTARRGPSQPIGVSILGGICALASTILTIVALAFSVSNRGFLLLSFVCMFGVYASVQFLRGRTSRLLVIALSLGALIDIVALIALPVYEANSKEVVMNPVILSPEQEEEVAIAAPASKTYVDSEELRRITWGIALLLIYAVIVLFILTPPVRRYFERSAASRIPPPPLQI